MAEETMAEVAEQTAAEATTEHSSEMPILRVEHLKKHFPIKRSFFGKPLVFLRAVDDVSFEVEKGTTIGVVGESGCGKTTLGRTILRLYDVDGGDVWFQGEEISRLKQKQLRKYRTDMQLIFQDPYSSLPPRMTVGAIISEGVRVHHIVPKEEVHDYVLGVMKACGLQPQYFDRYPHEFSGGQRQRICIARALAVKPKLVICDEPVSALDVSIQAQIINLLKELQTTMGLTYVFISHDLSVVKYITEQIMVMYLGTVMELGKTSEIFKDPLHPYTKALFSAVPVPNPDVKMHRIILEGDIPSPANPPKGCKFHTRCASCMNICRFKEPAYIEARPGHFVSCHLYDETSMADPNKNDEEYAAWLMERLTDPKNWRSALPELSRVDPEAHLNWVLGALPQTTKKALLEVLFDELARADKAKYFDVLAEHIPLARGKRRASLIGRLSDAEPEKHVEWLKGQCLAAEKKECAQYLAVLEKASPEEAKAVKEQLFPQQSDEQTTKEG